MCGWFLSVRISVLQQHQIFDSESKGPSGSFAILWEPAQHLSTSYVLPCLHLWCYVTTWCGWKAKTRGIWSLLNFTQQICAAMKHWQLSQCSHWMVWMRVFTFITRLKNTPPLLLILILSYVISTGNCCCFCNGSSKTECFQHKISLKYNCYKCEMQKNTYFHDKHSGQAIILCGVYVV